MSNEAGFIYLIGIFTLPIGFLILWFMSYLWDWTCFMIYLKKKHWRGWITFQKEKQDWLRSKLLKSF